MLKLDNVFTEVDDQFQQQRSGYDKDIRDIVRYFEASCRVEGALPPKVNPTTELDLFFGRGGASARSFQFRQQEQKSPQQTHDQVNLETNIIRLS